MRIAGIRSLWRGGGERRRETRQAVPSLEVDSPAVEAVLVDASDSGIGIEAERPLRIGVIYPFRLRRDELRSEIYGLVRWCDEAGPDAFRAGLSVGKTIGPPLSRLSS